jgi:Mor family transcriptional regulator
MGEGTKPKTVRNTEVYALRKKGKTFDEIAKKYDITRARAFEIFKREERRDRLSDLECLEHDNQLEE